MHRTEASALLRDELVELARRSRVELMDRVGRVEAYEVQGSGQVRYQIELELMWDDAPGGTLRAVGSIDDGGFRSSFRPLTDGFLMDADGAVEMADPEAER